jgi:hypothetical protein
MPAKKTHSTTPVQSHFDFAIQMQNEVNGIEMGVLENGIAYLTQSGLGEICGTTHSRISEITKEWAEHYNDDVVTKGRISFIRDYLFDNGYREPQLYVQCKQGNREVYAYPDIVCMAILEFYAFESSVQNKRAVVNYRKLAKFGFQDFIYKSLGYAPDTVWKYHLDRVSILKNKTPDGYYTVFQEIAGMIVDMIEHGVTVNDKTIADISVGSHWSKEWEAIEGNERFGQRVRYEHEYPEYYPQSYSNPQPAWAYPDSALAEFRKWFRVCYLPTKFPAYILKKVNLLKGGYEEAVKIIDTFKANALPKSSSKAIGLGGGNNVKSTAAISKKPAPKAVRKKI